MGGWVLTPLPPATCPTCWSASKKNCVLNGPVPKAPEKIFGPRKGPENFAPITYPVPPPPKTGAELLNEARGTCAHYVWPSRRQRPPQEQGKWDYDGCMLRSKHPMGPQPIHKRGLKPQRRHANAHTQHKTHACTPPPPCTSMAAGRKKWGVPRAQCWMLTVTLQGCRATIVRTKSSSVKMP